jgi:predicted amidophosphoribosyltransferase
MLFDMRTYVCRPGTIKDQLSLYEASGFATQRRHLGEPLLYAVTETGPLNSFVHIWTYDSAQDRAQRRAAMQADPEWAAYLAKAAAAGYLEAQENRLLVPVPFVTHRKPGAAA